MKNLTFLFLFISFLASLESYSQSLSGRVIYKVQVVGYGTNKESKFKEYNAAINEIANKQTLTLTFNSIQSSSVMDRYLISDAENNALNRSASAMAFVLTNGADYFFDKTSSTAVKRYNNGRLVKNTHKVLEWDITAESKKIDNYLCYKAVYLDKFVNISHKVANPVSLIVIFSIAVFQFIGSLFFLSFSFITLNGTTTDDPTGTLG